MVHAQIYMDPRIRDYVFIPLVVLMMGMQLIRITGMRYMNEPRNNLLTPLSVCFSTLVGTMFEVDADQAKKRQAEDTIDITKTLTEGTEANVKEGAAMARSQRVRKQGAILPENAVKTRKAFFCHETNGYFNRKIPAANPMSMMSNPDMMNNMLKQNIQSVIHMFMFTAIGNIFQGFITAQVPFPLGFKFK